MARVLFAWELGGGLGHLMRLAPIVRHFLRRGDEVFLAARDLGAAQRLFHGEQLTLLPVPRRQRAATPSFPAPHTFAHILHNVGFGDDESLDAHTAAWRGLYSLT